VRYLVGNGTGSGVDPTPMRLLAGGACDRPKGRLLIATITPAAAQGAFSQGEVDDDGLPMHLAYTIQGEDAVGHTTYPGVTEAESTRETTLLFGQGVHYLNYPGEVFLLGGKGLWLVDAQVFDAPDRHLHWHWLVRLVNPGDSFAMPAGHTVCGCFNPSATLEMSTGRTAYRLSAGAPPVPAFGEVTVSTTGSGETALWTYTGVFA
jgi:hypothetical protein